MTRDAIKHFGSERKLAEALGIAPPSVYSWGRKVPDLRQLQIERLTGGKLKAEQRILPAPQQVT